MTVPAIASDRDADDRALLDAACGGDERAYGVLLERHRCGLEVLCDLMFGDRPQADHALQEVVLAAWRERALAPRSSSVRLWLYRIAVRVCLELAGCAR